MGPGMVPGRGAGIALPTPPSHTHPGYTSPLPRTHADTLPGYTRQSNMAVGLKSVVQLTLGDHISDIGTITEVYNLSNIGRINNHFFIRGNE